MKRSGSDRLTILINKSINYSLKKFYCTGSRKRPRKKDGINDAKSLGCFLPFMPKASKGRVFAFEAHLDWQSLMQTCQKLPETARVIARVTARKTVQVTRRENTLETATETARVTARAGILTGPGSMAG